MPPVSPDARLPAAVPATVIAQAEAAARAASHRAGVVVDDVEEMTGLRQVSELLVSVWGRTPEGVPMPSEVMRGLAHAGGCTTAAFDTTGALVGAATLAVAAPCGTTYSLIAAVAPGGSDRGVGHAMKLHQRAWALRRGFRTMVWTFDPLVSRNARFNLTKLGAVADEYAPGFYGRMADHINGSGEADRLVACWQLDSGRAADAARGAPEGPTGATGPVRTARLLADGPDGQPMLAEDAAGRWLRVPRDVVELRRRSPREAEHWRSAVRDAFVDAFDHGLAATHTSRDGWYLLTPRSPR